MYSVLVFRRLDEAFRSQTSDCQPDDHSVTFQVKEVEDQISQRKAEVEKLIKEMREANMESLTISPPEESKQFIEGT